MEWLAYGGLSALAARHWHICLKIAALANLASGSIGGSFFAVEFARGSVRGFRVIISVEAEEIFEFA
jgi:hypothetical protein